jgi:hypothetical protein
VVHCLRHPLYPLPYLKVLKVFKVKDISPDCGLDLSAEARPGMAGLR